MSQDATIFETLQGGHKKVARFPYCQRERTSSDDVHRMLPTNFIVALPGINSQHVNDRSGTHWIIPRQAIKLRTGSRIVASVILPAMISSSISGRRDGASIWPS